MRVKALIGFGGLISMAQGQERDLPEDNIFRDLLEAGFIQALGTAEPIRTEGTGGEEPPAPLEEMTYNDLKRLAKDRGLNASGTKEELAKRIAEAGSEKREDQ